MPAFRVLPSICIQELIQECLPVAATCLLVVLTRGSVTQIHFINDSVVCVMMQSSQPDSQVETHLVDLLDFDKFALIKMLVQDRLKVVWCMRLNRAQNDDEHTRIQVRCCTTSFAL